LMQDGVQKTASFCASLCAERVVAARREMQQRWAEERSELERAYGVPSKPCSAGTPGAPRAAGVPNGGASTEIPLTAPQSWPDLFAQTRGFGEGRPASGSLRTAGCSAQSSAVHLQGVFDVVSNSASKAYMDPLSSEAVAYDSTFIDAYDAVQTLEERTNMASRAMDLLDEALQAAVGASAVGPASPYCAEPGSVHSFVSCSPGLVSGTVPAAAVCSPGIDGFPHPRDVACGHSVLSPHSQGGQSFGLLAPSGQSQQTRKSDANANAAYSKFHPETAVETFATVMETCQGSSVTASAAGADMHAS